MDAFKAVILGLIQGLTEFLPVSSSGNLAVAKDILNLGEVDFLFDILLHMGTLCAVLAVYGKTVVELIVSFFKSLKPFFTGKLRWKKADETLSELEANDPDHVYTDSTQRMIGLFIVSLVPLFLVLPFKSRIEELFSDSFFVGFMLIITSIFLFISDKIPTGHKQSGNMTVKDAVIIGFTQLFAVIPGISRSGSTITAGLACGLNRKYVAEFSFIMSIPTILAAFLLNLIEMLTSGGIDTTYLPIYLLGALVAAVSGYLAIKLLQYLLKSKKFIWFSIYCFALGTFAIVRGLLYLL